MWTEESEKRLEDLGEELENDTLKKVNALYADHVQLAMKRLKPALRELKEVEKKRPDMEPEKREHWLMTQKREILRRYHVIEILSRALADAGRQTAKETRGLCKKVYRLNYGEANEEDVP